MGLRYEWDKGQATTQAKLVTSQMNPKGQATKFTKRKPGMQGLSSTAKTQEKQWSFTKNSENT